MAVRKTKVVVVLAALIAIAGIVSWRMMSGPAVGSVNTSSELSEVKGAQMTLKTISNSFFTAQIPDNLTQKVSNESSGQGIYAQYLYTDTSFSATDQLGITLGHLNGLSIDEIPFVAQRRGDPTKYGLVSASSQQVIYKTFTKDEYMMLWINDGDYVAVTASGSSHNYSSLTDIVNRVESSWQWR